VFIAVALIVAATVLVIRKPAARIETPTLDPAEAK
jgi:hypothetical protein